MQRENDVMKKKTGLKIIASNPFQWIVDLFKNYKRPCDCNSPFDYLCIVSGRVDSPSPRDSRWEYILDAGMPMLEKVLNLEPIGSGEKFFIFPDRWLQPGEAVGFLSALIKNPDAKKFGKVYVVTNQPYLVSDCRREQVLILTNDSK